METGTVHRGSGLVNDVARSAVSLILTLSYQKEKVDGSRM